MAELFLGPVLEKLIHACSAYLQDQIRSQRGMKKELQKLQEILPKIQAVVSAYSQVEIEDQALNKWSWQLRDAVDEADDVLDDIEYRKYEKQASKNKVRSVKKTLKNRFVKFGKRVFKIDPKLKRLAVVVQKLDKILGEVSVFLDLLKGAKWKQEQEQIELLKTREAGSLPANVLLGRSKEMEFVRRWLRNPFEGQSGDITDLYMNISLLSVVGHGGMGKTTLLQHVYKDGVMEEFDVKMWVCVSTNFKAKTVIANMLKSIKKQVSDEDPLEALQRSLQSEVKSKRFLLVMDDIWEVGEGKWEDVLAPLQDGNPGSKILITTRMNSVASKIPMIENKETLQLKGLEENECFLLFKTHAFGKNSNVHESLISIAGDIVKKLSGCPLAAKIIGGSLKSKDVSYWRKVLNNDIGNLDQNDILPILKLSYTYLPNFLQVCFTFCCIFEQDHWFDKDDLVRMWIALGFIQSPNDSRETIEETGRNYFDILVEKSFFDKVDTGYKVHDLLHELAQSVSKQECFRIVDDKELSIPPKTIRHLSVNIDRSLEATFKKIGEFRNLRSLFLSYDAKYDENFVDVLSKILESSKNIRLLYIFAPTQRGISEMIGCLTHLRYLDLESEVGQLPRSISQLYHLQTIIVYPYIYADDFFFPKDINNLYNLRYLTLPFHENCVIYEIGKLNSLQELNCFNVKNEIGYGIGELEHMNELRQITICKLENIKDVEEACTAKLYDKKNLTYMSLRWGDNNGDRKNNVDHDLDEKVLDGIQPYNNIKRLCINAYMGVRTAIWMSNVSAISNLEYIKLEHCLKWKTLPPFGQLPFLKSLYLCNMPEVEQLDYNKNCTFPSLEVLYIKNLEALHEWFDTTVASENGCFLLCLTKLCLKSCPKLQELPSLPTKLQNLKMHNISWKGFNWLQGIRNCSNIDIRNSPNLICLTGRQELKPNENCRLIIDKLVIKDPSVLLMEPLRSISSLCSLKIEENDELVSFPNETDQWFLQHSSSLIELKFEKLQSLQSLPSSLESLSSLNTLHVSNLVSLQCLPSSLLTISSLKHFKLINIPLLKSLPNLPSSLEDLELEALQFLPSSLSIFSSLQHVRLRNIPLLESLPDLPSSLKGLEIEELESLQYLPSSLSTISSLEHLKLENIPLLKSLPDLPSSLEKLELKKLESLQCLPSSLSTISSLTHLKLKNIPLPKSLPDLPSSLEDLELEALQCLPTSVSTFSSLESLELKNIPLLKSLPDLSSSLEYLEPEELESLQRLLSSLSTISSLKYLYLINIPLLKALPELPSSLEILDLEELQNLDCMPSCLPSLLSILGINKVPRLLELPDLPASLINLFIRNCHPKLMERCENFRRR